MGVINSVVWWRDRRLKLRLNLYGCNRGEFGDVRHSETELIDGCNTDLEIINLSKFAVTVREIGFSSRWRGPLTVLVPTIPAGEQWPRKLEARESVTVRVDAENWIRQENNLADAWRVYAKTSCGTIRYGRNAILDRLREIGQERMSLSRRIHGD